MMVNCMKRENGASIEDLMTLTSWQRHTVRAALCRLRQREFVIMTKRHNGQTIYTLQQGQ